MTTSSTRTSPASAPSAEVPPRVSGARASTINASRISFAFDRSLTARPFQRAVIAEDLQRPPPPSDRHAHDGRMYVRTDKHHTKSDFPAAHTRNRYDLRLTDADLQLAHGGVSSVLTWACAPSAQPSDYTGGGRAGTTGSRRRTPSAVESEADERRAVSRAVARDALPCLDRFRETRRFGEGEGAAQPCRQGSLLPPTHHSACRRHPPRDARRAHARVASFTR